MVLDCNYEFGTAVGKFRAIFSDIKGEKKEANYPANNLPCVLTRTALTFKEGVTIGRD